jgi:transposase
MPKVVQFPEFWNFNWYVKAKTEGMSDHDIADYVGVSIMTINRWKKKNNIPKFKYTLTNAKGRDYNG